MANKSSYTFRLNLSAITFIVLEVFFCVAAAYRQLALVAVTTIFMLALGAAVLVDHWANQNKKGDAMEALNVGDIAVLNSGGPNLTVLALEGETAIVQWGQAEVKYGTFPTACLTKLCDYGK